jgi:hypothetical protein
MYIKEKKTKMMGLSFMMREREKEKEKEKKKEKERSVKENCRFQSIFVGCARMPYIFCYY